MDDQADPGIPAHRTDVAGSQGTQVGDHNVQVNFLFGGRRPSGPVVAGNVPQAPPAFQPREDLMVQLRAAGPGVSVVRAVTGMRGVGKTQLAAAYARECMDSGWRLVAWVNAEDTATVLKDLAVLATRLGIDRPGEALESIAQEVRNRLEADGDKCLVVFDNVADFAAIQPYVPALGRPQVVVTSTETRMPVARKPLTVDVFTEDEAVAFLADRTGRDEPAEAKVLAGELGHLPLALAQAAAVIAVHRLSYQVYLDRLRANPAREQLPPSKDDPYPRGVADAILLSIDAVTADDPTGACNALLGIISLLSAEGVSREMLEFAGPAGLLSGEKQKGLRRRLRGGREVPAAATGEALGRLADASLLTFSTDGGRVLAHRLVMRVIRDRAAREGTLSGLSAVTVRLLHSYPIDEPWKDRVRARDCIQQVIALSENCAELLGGAQLEHLLALRGWAVGCLNALGDGAVQAIALGVPLVAERELIQGDTHPDTLTSRNNLALAYRMAGRLGEAVRLYERTLADSVRVLGDTHPGTLTSRNNLATAYRMAGRLGEAVPLHERTLSDHVRVLGDTHPDTLTARNNLAVAYRAAGRLSEAVLLHERTLADRVRLLGDDHPDTLRSRNNLALAYRATGRLDEAIALFEDALAGLERVRGAGHPDVDQVRNHLEAARADAGRPQGGAPD